MFEVLQSIASDICALPDVRGYVQGLEFPAKLTRGNPGAAIIQLPPERWAGLSCNGLGSEPLACPRMIDQNRVFDDESSILTNHARAWECFAFRTAMEITPLVVHADLDDLRICGFRLARGVIYYALSFSTFKHS